MITIKKIPGMPGSWHGMVTVDNNGDYFIFVNENLSPEAIDETVLHEMEHIKQGDLYKRDESGHVLR